MVLYSWFFSTKLDLLVSFSYILSLLKRHSLCSGFSLSDRSDLVNFGPIAFQRLLGCLRLLRTTLSHLGDGGLGRDSWAHHRFSFGLVHTLISVFGRTPHTGLLRLSLLVSWHSTYGFWDGGNCVASLLRDADGFHSLGLGGSWVENDPLLAYA